MGGAEDSCSLEIAGDGCSTERPQRRNHHGHRSEEATARRIARGQERERAAEAAEAATTTAPEATPAAPGVPATEPKVEPETPATEEKKEEEKTDPVAPAPAVEEKKPEPEAPATGTAGFSSSNICFGADQTIFLAEMVVKADPTSTPGPPALKAGEAALVNLVPRSERQRPRRVS